MAYVPIKNTKPVNSFPQASFTAKSGYIPIKASTPQTGGVLTQSKGLYSPMQSVMPEAGVKTKTLPGFLGGGQYLSIPGQPNKLATSTRAYGGLATKPGSERDHIIPVALGGTSDDPNLQYLESKKNILQKIFNKPASAKNRQEGKMLIEWGSINDYQSGKISLGEARFRVLTWNDQPEPFYKSLAKGIIETSKKANPAYQLMKGAKGFITDAVIPATKVIRESILPQNNYRNKFKFEMGTGLTLLQKAEAEKIVNKNPLDELPSFNFMDKVRELKDKPQQLVPFLAGADEAYKLSQLLSSAYKLKQNEATEQDIIMLQNYIQQADIDRTFGYKVLDTISYMPSFAGELYVTGGLATAGRAATIKTAKEGLKFLLTKSGKELLDKKVAQFGLKVVGEVAGRTVQTPVAGATRIVAGTLEKQLQGTLSQEDKEEDLTASLIKSVGEQWVETVSEFSGGLLTTLSKPVKNKLLKVAFFSAFQKANPVAKVNDLSRIVNRAGWHGVFGEMFEERVADVGHGILYELGLGNQKFSIPSAEQLAIEFVAFSVPGTAIALIDKYTPQLKSIEKIVNEAKQSEAGFAKVPGTKPIETTKTPEKIPTLEQGVAKYTPNSHKTSDAIAQSTNQKVITTKDGKTFELGSYGISHYETKVAENKFDRFSTEELSNTIKNITKVYRASNNQTNYRYDNVVHIAEMPSGETRAIYTRLNNNNAEEIIAWHKIPDTKKSKYLATLESFGTPDRTRTGISNLEDSRGILSTTEASKTIQQPDNKVKPVKVDKNLAQFQKKELPTRPAILDKTKIPVTKALKQAQEITSRLKLSNIVFDMADIILTHEGAGAFGAALGNKIYYEQTVPKFTGKHEVIHIIHDNVDNIKLFKQYGITKAKLNAELKRISGGEDIKEILAENGELRSQFQESVKKTTWLKRFFAMIKDFFSRIFNKKNGSIVTRFLEVVEKGKAKEPTIIKPAGFISQPSVAMVNGKKVVSFMPSKPGKTSFLSKGMSDKKVEIKSPLSEKEKPLSLIPLESKIKFAEPSISVPKIVLSNVSLPKTVSQSEKINKQIIKYVIKKDITKTVENNNQPIIPEQELITTRKFKQTKEWQDFAKYAEENLQTKDIHPAIAFRHITLTAERVAEFLDGGINGETYKKIIKPVYDSAEKVNREANLIKNEFDKFKILEGGSSDRNASLFAQGELNEATPNQMAAAKYVRNKYDEFLTRLNQTRTKLGVEPIPKRADYVSHINELNVLSELFGGFERISTQKLISKLKNELLDKHPDWSDARAFDAAKRQVEGTVGIGQYVDARQPSFRFAKKRISDYEKNPSIIRSFSMYTSSALRYIHQAENVARNKAFKDVLPANAKEFIRLWNTEQVAGRVPPSFLSPQAKRYLSAIKGTLGANTILGNLATTMMQLTSFPQVFATAGVKNTFYGISKRLISYVSKSHSLWNISRSKALRNLDIDIGLGDSLIDKLLVSVGKINTLRNPAARSRQAIHFGRNILMSIMETADQFTVGASYEAFYKKAISDGLLPDNAKEYADIMTGKTQANYFKEALPPFLNTIEGKTIGQFGTYTMNQWEMIRKDLGKKFTSGEKSNKNIRSVFKQFLIFLTVAYLIDSLGEKTFGRQPYDIKSLIDEIIKGLKGKSSFGEEVGALKNTVASYIPFMGSVEYKSMPPFFDFGKDVISATLGSGEAQQTAIDDLSEKWIYNILLPYGGGQVRKTLQGTQEIIGVDLPFVKNTPKNIFILDNIDKAKSILFGVSATQAAMDYYNRLEAKNDTKDIIKFPTAPKPSKSNIQFPKAPSLNSY